MLPGVLINRQIISTVPVHLSSSITAETQVMATLLENQLCRAVH